MLSVAGRVDGCSAASVRNVTTAVNAGGLQLVRNARGALTSFGAPEGFAVQVVSAPAGTAAASVDFSAVDRRCQFSLAPTALNARRQFTFRTCAACFRCLQALAFRCGSNTNSLYVRVQARAGASRAYAVSAWSAPLPFALPCSAPAGVSCFA